MLAVVVVVRGVVWNSVRAPWPSTSSGGGWGSHAGPATCWRREPPKKRLSKTVKAHVVSRSR